METGRSRGPAPDEAGQCRLLCADRSVSQSRTVTVERVLLDDLWYGQRAVPGSSRVPQGELFQIQE